MKYFKSKRTGKIRSHDDWIEGYNEAVKFMTLDLLGLEYFTIHLKRGEYQEVSKEDFENEKR